MKVWLSPQHIGGPQWSFFYGVAPSFCYVLAISLVSAARESFSLRETLWFAAAALVYELLQPFLPGRRFDPFDLAAVLLGSGAYLAYRRWRAPVTSSAPAARP